MESTAGHSGQARGRTGGILEGIRLLPNSIWLPLLAISLLGAGVFLFNEWSVAHIRDANEGIERQLSMQKDLIEMRGQLVNAETAQRGYLLTRDRAYLPPFDRAVESLPIIGARLHQAARDDAALIARISQLEQLRGRKMAELGSSVALISQGSRDEALIVMRTGEGRWLMEQFRTEIDAILAEVGDRLAKLQRNQSVNLLMSRVAFALLAFLTLLLLLLVVRLFAAEFVRREGLRHAEEHERRRLESIVAERTQELSELTTHLQNISEQEKAELARDLHDELGGLLTAARMDLAWLQGRSVSMDDEFRNKIAELSSGLSEAMNLKRRVVENLRPALLDHFGLPTALQAYFEETCKKAGLECTADIPDEFEPIPQNLAIALFRVGQESLTNIVRHARASNVEMSFAREGDSYVIKVADDGQGMDPQMEQAASSHGLRGMRHRVESLDGRFEIRSTPGYGTEVEISVPRPRPAAPA